MTRQYWANLALCVVMGALVIFAVTTAGSALTPKGLFMNEPRPSDEAATMLEQVEMTKYRIVKGLDNTFLGEFYIQNNSSQSVKNVSVLCDFEDENGKHSDREIWLLAETIPSLHQLKISSVTKRFVNTRSRSLDCSITDLHVVEEPAFKLERHAGGGHESASDAGHGEQSPAGH